VVADTWRYLVDPKHLTWSVLGFLCLVGIVGFGVYATIDGPPATSEGVVYFTATATKAQKDAVRAACPSVGGAIEEPPDRNSLVLTQVYPLRYNLTKASSSDRARLFACVSKQPGVIGINTETSGDE
jgi:hypothetical protein